MKAYRIHIVDDKVYGRLERNINENQNRTVDTDKVIEIKDRPYLADGMLYCPDIDKIVDESEKIKLNKQIDTLTEVRTPEGRRLRHLNEITKEERDLYSKLEDLRYTFYKRQLSFIDLGKEEQYLKNLSEIYKDA